MSASIAVAPSMTQFFHDVVNDALRALSGVYSRFELPSALPLYRALASLPDRSDDDLHLRWRE